MELIEDIINLQDFFYYRSDLIWQQKAEAADFIPGKFSKKGFINHKVVLAPKFFLNVWKAEIQKNESHLEKVKIRIIMVP